jgi:hypothetical protein
VVTACDPMNSTGRLHQHYRCRITLAILADHPLLNGLIVFLPIILIVPKFTLGRTVDGGFRCVIRRRCFPIGKRRIGASGS